MSGYVRYQAGRFTMKVPFHGKNSLREVIEAASQNRADGILICKRAGRDEEGNRKYKRMALSLSEALGRIN